jgi:molybdopterin molybdotransferase
MRGSRMIAPETAWELLLPHLTPLPARLLPLAAAGGRVLAEPITATVDVPFADVSAVDGYALGGDPHPDRRLPVRGMIPAGEAPGRRLDPGTALRIMTGACVPLGADRVVPVEDTDDGSAEVAIHRPPPAGAHVRRHGEVHRRGDELLHPGELVTPGAAALLATHGRLEVAVHRPPRVALIVTGDEVVPAEAEPGPGQLRDSHSAFLRAALAGSGAELTTLGIAPDRPAELRDHIAAGLGFDVLLLSGGVSRGELDFVEGALAALGFRALFDAVAVQPGKPLVAAVPASGSGPLVFGLPGNPASVMVCCWLFVMPALRRLQGHDASFWGEALPGLVASPLAAGSRRDRFLPAVAKPSEVGVAVTPLAPRGSHDLGAYARGNALLRVPAGAPPAAAGDPCSWLPLSTFAGT